MDIIQSLGVLELLIRRATTFDNSLTSSSKTSSSLLSGVSHIQYRGKYDTLQDVIDGDLCEYFFLLDFATQCLIADEMQLSVLDVRTLLEEMREIIP
jgi:hypothetical protein